VPARIIRQNSEIKEIFRQKIKEKVAREKEEMKVHIDEELPSWITWALKPIAGVSFDLQRRRDDKCGEAGEDKAILGFWLLLTKEWVLINDVVLEPEPDEFIQLDHVLIGPPGMYLIETKAWDGAFSGYKDKWKRKQGNSWVFCKSPTGQNQRHARLFRKWLVNNLVNNIDASLKDEAVKLVFPIVLFTRAKWLKVQECCMPVFESGLALSWHLRRQAKNVMLSSEQIEVIGKKIIIAESLAPLARKSLVKSSGTKGSWSKCNSLISEKISSVISSPEQVEIKQTKDGRKYVKVVGSKDEAERVRARYSAQGCRPLPVKSDRFTKGAWYFYLENLPSG